jgi:hypothetical protein
MAFFRSVFQDKKQASQPPTEDRGPMWTWFRRIFFGAVIEGLLEQGVVVDFASLALSFGDRSRFQVPHIDNYMRFSGEMTATVAEAPSPATLDALRATLLEAWPSLVGVVDIPVGDRLTVERNDIAVTIEGDRIRITFDLEAD